MESVSQLFVKFKNEPKSKRILLLSSFGFLVGSFLPWINFPFNLYTAAYFMNIKGMSGISVNGWHGLGVFGTLAAIGILGIWLLTQMKIIPNRPKEKQVLVDKILVLVMLICPIVWLVDMGFAISLTGIGLWICLLSGGAGTYAVFQGEFPDLKSKSKK